MQIKDQIQMFGSAPSDQLVEQLEAIGVVTFKQAVMERNSNRVEARPMQERDVLPSDVVLAVLPPEFRRPFWSKQLEHQRSNLSGRLRATFEQPHVTFRHQPVTQICCTQQEWFTRGIDDLFMVGVGELRAPLGG